MPRRWVESKTEFYPNGNRVLKRAKPRIVIEHLCGFLSGHEISETEKGYGGGKFIDCNCRWCDKAIKVPVQECNIHPVMKQLMEGMNESNN